MDVQHISDGPPRSACGWRLDHRCATDSDEHLGFGVAASERTSISRLACSSIMWVSVHVAKPASRVR
jgi:hypothetical protein